MAKTLKSRDRLHRVEELPWRRRAPTNLDLMSDRLQRSLTIVLAGGLTLAAPGYAVGQWPNGIRVVDTPHNLTVPASSVDPDMVNQIANYGEVCVYCHAPHGGSVDGELWNRRTPTGPYEMYDGGTNMILDPQPSGNSLRCLSCHDGTIGLDVVANTPATFSGPTWGVTIDDCEGCHSGGNPDGGVDWEGVWFDTDLRRQHPVSIIYDPTLDPGFRSVAEVESAGLPLFDGRVQCMTCHDPHTQEFRPFLRISAAGRALCLACHTSNPAEPTAHFW